MAQPLADSCELSICNEEDLAEVHHVIASIPDPFQLLCSDFTGGFGVRADTDDSTDSL